VVKEKFAFKCRPSSSFITHVLYVVRAFVAFQVDSLHPQTVNLLLTTVRVANATVLMGTHGIVAMPVTLKVNLRTLMLY
jgi:hypothetical protein